MSATLAAMYSPSAIAVPTFSPRTSLCSDVLGSQGIDVMDFDGDGNTDVLGGSTTISLCKNQGNGTFATSALVTGTDVSTVIGADMDLDSYTDIVGLNQSPLGLHWWRNNGDNTFYDFTIDTSVDATTRLYTTDMDADGDKDILGALPTSNQIVEWRNDDAGPVVPSRMYINNNVSGDYKLVAIDPDTETETATIPLGNTSGDMVASPNGRKLYVTSNNDLLVIDVLTNTVIATVPGAGGVDLAVSPDGKWVYSAFWVGTSQGVRIHVISTATNAVVDTIIDSALTTCRTLDGMVSKPSGNTLYLMCADSSGYRFGHFFIIDTTTKAVTYTTTMSVTNYSYYNTVGINDLAVKSDGSEVYFYRTRYVTYSMLDVFDGANGQLIQSIKGPYTGTNHTLHGDVAVTPDGSKAFAADYGWGPQIFDLTTSSGVGFLPNAGRFSNTITVSLDGTKVYTVYGNGIRVSDTSTYAKLNTITGSFSSASQIAITPGNDGSGAFHKIVIDSSFTGASSVTAADMDNDGQQDIVGTASGGNEVAVWHNNGDDTYTKSVVSSSYAGAATVRAADIDGDGWNDLVTSASSPADVSWWQNNHDGTYTRHIIDTVYADDMEITDFDHDGYPDIAGFDTTGSRILWWRNDGTGAFTQYVVDTGFQSPQGFEVGDLNGDSFDDMVGAGNSGSVSTSQLYWWPNSGPHVTVTPTSGLVTSETGTTATFTMVLDVKPSGDVTIDLSSSDTTEGTVSPPSVTFTPLNWDQPQTVTVTGVDDNVPDGSIAYTIVTAAATSSDTHYDGVNPADVSVINADDDNIRTGGPYAYIANSGDNTVSVIDTTTHQVIATVPVGSGPWGVAVNPNGTYVYVTNNDGTISVIDMINNTPAGTSTITGSLADVTFNPAGTAAYIAAGGEVAAVDAASHAKTADIVTSPNPLGGAAPTLTTGVGMDPGGTYAYAVSTQGLYISTINTATHSVVNSTVLSSDSGSNTYDVAISPSGTYAYVPDYGLNVVYVYNTGSHALVSTVPVGVHPMGIVVDHGGNYVYVANQGSQSVSVIDTASNTVATTVAVGSNPEGISITPTGDEVYVVNHGANNVSVISTATKTVTTTIAVGSQPTSIGEFISPPSPIQVTPVTGLTTTEGGGADTFSIVLTRQPTADVTIGLSSSDTTEGTVSTSAVTFTTSNWNTPQTVTVTGVDDTISDGNIAYTIVTAPAFSLDRAFDGIDPSDVAVTNYDNEPAGFNAVEAQTGTAPAADKDAVTGKIHTKVVGQAFNLDIVALKDSDGDGVVDSVETSYPTSVDHTVQLEVGTGTCSSFTVLETLPSVMFTVANQPTEQGRKQVSLTIHSAGQNLRIRMTDNGGTPTDTSDDLVGCSTDIFTVRPVSYSLKVSQGDWQTPGDTDLNNGTSSGTLVHKAGRPVRVTVTALDGGSAVVSGFANHTVTLVETKGDAAMRSGDYFYAGGVTPAQITFDGSGSGTAVDDTATYKEVGWLTLEIKNDDTYAKGGGDGAPNDGSTAAEMEIQGSGLVTVGRFVPDHFTVAVNNTGAFGPACGGTFTYMGQGFGLQSSPVLAITAQNTGGDTTQNYQGSYWKLGDISESYVHATPAINGAIVSLASNGTPTHTWASASGSNGVNTVTFDTAPLVYARTATAASPFSPEIDLQFPLQDSDGVTCASCVSNAYSLVTNNGGTGIPGPGELRYGRLAFTPDPNDNHAEGPETSAITKGVEAEYYNGTNWVVNASDTCTAITAANDDLKSDVDDPPLGNDTVNVGASGQSTLSIADSPLTGAATDLNFSAPGTFNTGTVDFILNLAAPANPLSWLQYDWDGNGSLDNLQGRVRFGPYDNKRWMYMREPW